MTFCSLNHLRFSVRDVEVTDAFYDTLLRHLGFSKRPRDDGIAWQRSTGRTGRHWLIFTKALPEFCDLPVQEPEAPGIHHLALNAESRDAVDFVHALLTARGYQPLTPPAEYDFEPGYYAVFFRDPDGVKIEIVHSPTSSGLGEAMSQ